MTAWGDGPPNGGSPISISYRVQARLYWSLRPSTVPPTACSGLMYCGVPTTIPVAVIRSSAPVAGDLERGLERKLLIPSEPLPKGLPLGIRHHVVEQSVGLSRVVERKHMGMLQRRGDPDLAEEPVTPQHRRQLGLEHLDGDLPAVLQVLGEEHDSHPAVAELPLHAVPIAECRLKLREDVHGCPFTGERCLSNRWRQATSRCQGRQKMCFSTSRAGGPSSPRAFTNPTLGQ